MGNILEDKTKFLNMGSINLHDNTAKNEQKLQKRLLDLVVWLKHGTTFSCCSEVL